MAPVADLLIPSLGSCTYLVASTLLFLNAPICAAKQANAIIPAPLSAEIATRVICWALRRRIWSMKRLFLAAFIFLSACSGRPDLDDPSLGGPDLNLEEYFTGELKAYGQFQDRFGNALRRFEVDISGQFDGRTLTIQEDFIYEDGTTEQRIWSLTKTGADTWVGTAPGVIGVANGEERADVFNWKYEIDLPVPEGTLRVTFDDWMWRLDEDRVLNRAYMNRFGIEIGEVIIFFEKL